MAASNVKATAITNADTYPPTTMTSRAVGQGYAYRKVGYCAMTSGDEAASVYRFARVPSNAVIHSIRMFKSAAYAGASNVADIGIYQTSGNGGAVDSRRAFVSGMELSGAGPLVACSGATGLMYAGQGLELRFGAGGAGYGVPSGVEYKVWQLLGSGSDTQREYDLAMTISGAAAPSAVASPVTFAFIVDYVIE